MCVFVVLGLVFPYQAKRLSWGNVRKMTYFVSSWTQNLNSINQSVTRELAITIYLLTAASKLLLYCTAAASLIWRHWSVCHAVIISVAPPVGSPVCRYHVLCQFSSVVARPLKVWTHRPWPAWPVGIWQWNSRREGLVTKNLSLNARTYIFLWVAPLLMIFEWPQTITLLATAAPCGPWGVLCSWFICWFRRCVCLFTSYALILFSSLFPYLSFPLRIHQLHFQARGRKLRPNPGFFSCFRF